MFKALGTWALGWIIGGILEIVSVYYWVMLALELFTTQVKEVMKHNLIMALVLGILGIVVCIITIVLTTALAVKDK